MKAFVRFLILLLHRVFSTDSCEMRPAGEAGSLSERIEKYKAHAAEFERLGCPGLARNYRESAQLCERELARARLLAMPATRS